MTTTVQTSPRLLRRTLALLDRWTLPYTLSALVHAANISVCFNLVLAFLMKGALDAAQTGDIAFLLHAAFLAGGTFFGGTPLLMLTSYIGTRSLQKMLTQVRIRLFQHTIQLPISQLSQQHSGDRISRFTNDLATLESLFNNALTSLAMGLVIGTVGTVMILSLDWRLGLGSVILGLLTTLNSAAFTKPIRSRADRIQASLGALTERASDLIQSLPVTKMFQLESVVHGQYKNANAALVQAELEQAHLDALHQTTLSLLNWLRSIGTLVVGLLLISSGQLELGALWAIIHLQSNTSFMFSNFGQFLTRIQTSLAGAARIFEVLDSPVEAALPALSDPAPLPDSRASVRIEKLSFSYNRDDREDSPVLKDINLNVQQGQIAALVGPSGGGKSTLLKLLMGFYPIDRGTILLGNSSLQQIPMPELRERIAYVPQNAYLFDDTIMENIRYGKLEAGDQAIFESARRAQAHEFILEQPEGYDTRVGERGAKLSGGQRQRIAIARAMLKDAPILLLDEATSALDSESELLVQQALNRLMQGRTTLVVAHRLSTIENADMIYVIEAGAVVEQGSHEELLERDGLYTRLYQLQFRKHPISSENPRANG
ncbi:MAG: ABC transporter ATP-binding protein [Anaerolineales bacterium]|nr:ABC transporter ATP-binding protein [Anaerolineales bacterium]